MSDEADPGSSPEYDVSLHVRSRLFSVRNTEKIDLAIGYLVEGENYNFESEVSESVGEATDQDTLP
jgi:hypothetical protein